MKTPLRPAAVLAALLTATHPLCAQQAAPMPGMSMPAQPAHPAAGSMMSGMDKMMKDMKAVPMTGDADRDFVGMMIPHHQGAIDMARSELARGKDPALLALARAIVDAQQRELSEMHGWQAKHPPAP